MTLVVGTDSYISVEDADLYFDNALNSEPWNLLDDATKERALKVATKKINSLMFIGRPVTPDQILEFPRSIYNSGRQCWTPETEIAQCVKDASCEEAIALLRGGTEATQRAELQRQGVTSFTLGKLSETYGGSSTGNRMQSVTAAQLLSRYTGGSRAIG